MVSLIRLKPTTHMVSSVLIRILVLISKVGVSHPTTHSHSHSSAASVLESSTVTGAVTRHFLTSGKEKPLKKLSRVID